MYTLKTNYDAFISPNSLDSEDFDCVFTSLEKAHKYTIEEAKAMEKKFMTKFKRIGVVRCEVGLSILSTENPTPNENQKSVNGWTVGDRFTYYNSKYPDSYKGVHVVGDVNTEIIRGRETTWLTLGDYEYRFNCRQLDSRYCIML